MTPDVKAFLEAIASKPDDATPQLIYAKWLEDRGDPRGEFIRVSCQSVRLADDDSRREKLEQRRRELLEAHEAEWLAPVADFCISPFFHGGFVRSIVTDPERFPEWAEALFEAEPLIVNVTFVANPGFDQFKVKCHDRDSILYEYVRSGPGWGAISDKTMRALAELPQMSRLRQIKLSNNRLADTGLRALVGSLHLTRLREFGVSNTGIGTAATVALAASAALTSLSRLDLGDNEQIGDAGVKALAESPLLTRLTNVNLGSAWYPNQIVRSLPVAMLRATNFNLGDVHLTERELGIAMYPLPADPTGTGLTDAGVRALATASWTQLRRLVLTCNGIGDDGAATLASSPYLWTLVDLDLRQNRVGVAGLTALQRSPHLTGLKEIGLSKNPAGPWCDLYYSRAGTCEDSSLDFERVEEIARRFSHPIDVY